MLDRALCCRWLTLSVALCDLSALSAPAQASEAETPVSARLDWQRATGAESCMDAKQVEQAVEERLQRQVFVANDPDVVLEGHVSHASSDTWLVELELRGAQGQAMGTRALETRAKDCSALDDSIALVLAVMLDIPTTHIPEPPAPAEPKPATPDVQKRPPPPSTRLRVPDDTPPRREPWRLEVGASGIGAVGLLPEASLGLGLRALVTPPRFWTLGLEVMALSSVDANVSDGDAGANFAPKSIGLWVCPLSFDLNAVDTRACLVEHVGRLRVEGFGFDENQATTRTYVNAGLRLDAFRALVGPLGATLTLGLDVPIVRETFRFGDRTGENSDLFRMEPVLGLAQIGLAARFW